MSDITAIVEEIAKIDALAKKAIEGPWTVGPHATDIWAPSRKGGSTRILDIRGWGYLTGNGIGALGLSDDDGIAVQRANGDLVCALRNLVESEHWPLIRSALTWRPIETADKGIAVEHRLGDITIRHTYPIWARTGNGKPLQVVWSVRDDGTGYWWDLDGEEVTEPDEWMPHPFDPLPSPPQSEGGPT